MTLQKSLMSHVTIVSVSVAAAGMFAAAAAGAGDLPSYTISPADPHGQQGDLYVRGINQHQQMIGSQGPWPSQVAVRWMPGAVPVLLDLGPPFTYMEAMSINSGGDVAGIAAIPPGGNGPYTHHIFLYTDAGGLVDLDLQSMGAPYNQFGAQSHTLMINDRRDIVGELNVSGMSNRLFCYSEGEWIDLGAQIPGNTHGGGRLVDMTTDGEVLISSGYMAPPYLYSTVNGTMTPLGLPITVEAKDMSEPGMITGRGHFSGGFSAFRYVPGEGLENLDPERALGSSRGEIVTDSGKVFGFGDDDFFLWSEEAGLQMFNISSLEPDARPFDLIDANDRGEALGFFIFNKYAGQTFYWSPETGAIPVQDLLDPEADEYLLYSVEDIDESGSILLNAKRQSDFTIVPLLLTPPGGVAPAGLADVSMPFGSIISGGAPELAASDDSYLHARSQFGFSAQEPNIIELVSGFDSPQASPAAIDVAIESRLNNPGGRALVRLLNFASGAYEQVGAFATSQQDTVNTIADIDPTDRVRASDGRVQVSTRISVIATFSAAGFDAWFDEVAVNVR